MVDRLMTIIVDLTTHNPESRELLRHIEKMEKLCLTLTGDSLFSVYTHRTVSEFRVYTRNGRWTDINYQTAEYKMNPIERFFDKYPNLFILTLVMIFLPLGIALGEAMLS